MRFVLIATVAAMLLVITEAQEGVENGLLIEDGLVSNYELEPVHYRVRRQFGGFGQRAFGGFGGGISGGFNGGIGAGIGGGHGKGGAGLGGGIGGGLSGGIGGGFGGGYGRYY